jgi:hypothetical protein
MRSIICATATAMARSMPAEAGGGTAGELFGQGGTLAWQLPAGRRLQGPP